MERDAMLTPREAAEYLKVPVETIWRWCREGTLPAIKIGKYWRVPADQLTMFIKSKGNLPLKSTGEIGG